MKFYVYHVTKGILINEFEEFKPTWSSDNSGQTLFPTWDKKQDALAVATKYGEGCRVGQANIPVSPSGLGDLEDLKAETYV